MEVRPVKKLLFLFLLSLAGTACCETIIETEKPKDLKPTGSLSTCGYAARDAEKAYLKKPAPSELVTGSMMEEYSIHGRKDKYVSWFAVVRGITPETGAPNRYQLLLEQKYFDGFTDCHIMLVAISGSGDFTATVTSEEASRIPLLSLVRVYGKVTDEANNQPKVEAEYVRVWPWMAFTFTDLGPGDHGNPRWRKLCKPCKGGRVYEPYPTEDYYRNVLGDPKDFQSPEQGKAAH